MNWNSANRNHRMNLSIVAVGSAFLCVPVYSVEQQPAAAEKAPTVVARPATTVGALEASQVHSKRLILLSRQLTSSM